MSVNPNFFIGTVEGHPFVAAHAIGQEAQQRAGVAVDIVSPLNGTRIPEFEENNWLVRPIATGADAEVVVANAGDVHRVGEVAIEEVARYVGPAITEKVLKDRQ